MFRHRALPLWALAFSLTARAPAAAPPFGLQTATEPQNGNIPVRIVLTWPEPTPQGNGPPLVRFNLYRKIDLSAPYPKSPLNFKPLEVYTDCTKLQDLVPAFSADWDSMRLAISGSLGDEFVGAPCTIAQLPRSSAGFQKLQLLARSRWPVAVVLAQGFLDEGVVQGKTYYYQLRGLDAQDKEVVLASDVAVTAGVPAALPPPQGISAVAGDHRVLLHWPFAPGTAGYDIYRSLSPNGSYSLINDLSQTSLIKEDLQGEPLSSNGEPDDGFLDFQRWDFSGNPEAHEVAGTFIDGPDNGLTYYYKVASVDLLGNQGPLSQTVSAMPADTTPPGVPSDVTVISDEASSQIEVRWAASTRDVDGHPESVQAYRVFRRDEAGGDDTVGVQVAGPVAQPPKGTTLVQVFDADSALRPAYGEKTFWYAVECVDAQGNKSARSAGIPGHLKDILAPAPTRGLRATGSEESITVSWNVSLEPDVDSYQIYRSLCDAGLWACARRDPNVGQPCESSFVYLGMVSQEDAELNGAKWVDLTVPKGSPLCYAYIVKAVDQAQNRSGSLPPDPAEEEIVCQRLRDTTPPEPAIIVGLTAQEKAIKVDWIGAPVQDIRAYHVYRAIAENAVFLFAGGMTVEKPPQPPQLLTTPYQAQAAVGCADIPLELHERMSAGSLVDTGVEPKRIYWYKVVGIDWAGNETPLTQAVQVSTFTYTAKDPPAPGIASIGPSTQPCGLHIQWSPAFDGSKHLGFALLRRETSGGLYLQIGTLLGDSQYLDQEVVSGVTYWYRVAQLNADGTSSLSLEKSGQAN